MRRRGSCACFFVGLAFLSTLASGDEGLKAKPADKPNRLPPAAKRQVDFLKDIKPILAHACYECHGADAQEAGLRLHAKARALAGGDSGPAIVAGKSAQSRLILFVAGQNEDGILMPPEGEGDRLSDEQIGLLRAWIDQGAKWPDEGPGATVAKSGHWSFQPIGLPALPPVKQDGWVRNPIDRFVLANLEGQGLAPSPEAQRHTLIRRAALDLTGLPPSPEQLSRFLNDTSPEAYERLIDRLLASPHYGERWARHWLDLARYADSDGYEKDRARPFAWRYREWVIRAINRDLPFDEFTIEQLAGDLLPNATIEQKVATGFHRNTLTNLEGGVDREEDRVKQTIDRTNTTGAVWLGLTVGCAQCHSHKYDPISQREYYQFYAFFNSLQEVNIPAPLTHEDDSAFQQATAQHARRLAKLKAEVAAYIQDQLPARQAAWEQTAAGQSPTWTPLTPSEARSAAGATLTVQSDGSVLAAGKNPDQDTYAVVMETATPGITAIRLEVLADASLPAKGPGRVKHGNFVLSELALRAGPAKDGQPPAAVGLRNATADFSQGAGANGWPVAAAVDGKPETGWAISPRFGKDHVAVFETDKPIAFDGGAKLVLTLDQQYGSQHTIGRFRVSVTTHKPPIPAGGLPDAVAQALNASAAKPTPTQPTPAQRVALANYYRSIDPELKKLNAAIAAEKPPQRKDKTMAPVLADMAKPRETHVLIRGDFLRPGDIVHTAAPAVLPELDCDGRRATRLDLARWLVDPANPLTARVQVNRVWQRYFGRGLVSSSHDFGTQGDLPTHPRLLDWLASQFMARGWSMKQLHKLIVTSATYRQSSRTRADLKDRDPYNKLLARQRRLRVQAEVVRDLALSASGLLAPQVGGPSVHPPQPDGIASLGYANSVKWKTSAGADRYRRGLYTFFQRTVPYPMFMDFDAPDSNVTCTRRERSNTPLSALTLQNDPVFVECSQAFARRVLNEVPSAGQPSDDRDRRIAHAFMVCLARAPDAEELEFVADLYDTALGAYREDAKAASELAGKLPKPAGASDAQLASWSLVGRTLMNLDEFITRE